MNLLFITVYRNLQYGGGAASATLNLAKNMEQAGHHSKILTREDFPDPFENNALFQIPVKTTFSASPFGQCDEQLLAKIEQYDPDIIVFGAIDREFISPFIICEIKKPIILIFHDLYPVTGGCLFQGGIDIEHTSQWPLFYELYRCQAYQKNCEACPVVEERHQSLVRLDHHLKKEALLARKDIVLAAVSTWMQATLASIPYLREHRSKLLYNLIDERLFKNQHNQNEIRKKYNLPINKKLALLIAHSIEDHQDRKGFALFLEALAILQLTPEQIEFCAVGTAVSKPQKMQIHGFTFHFIGYISDAKEKANIYSASDLFISTSLHENLPMVCLESLSCGTPVVAYGVGGIASDIVKHKHNGYLAKPFLQEDLTRGIQWLCKLPEKEYQELVSNGQIHIKNKFSGSFITKQFEEIAKLAKEQYQEVHVDQRLWREQRKNMQSLLQYAQTKFIQLQQDHGQLQQDYWQLQQNHGQLQEDRGKLQQDYGKLQQDHWYRFGQLSRKRKLWLIAKVLSKRLGMYTFLGPLAGVLKRILEKKK